MKDKELKLEETEVSQTLGGVIKYITKSIVHDHKKMEKIKSLYAKQIYFWDNCTTLQGYCQRVRRVSSH